ncbi:MAG: GTPase Era [Oscillospiraceae bacterium]|nr:GTPase Era [Oscillospiraceae bacterium]MBR2897257.1 GTPase Era [Oscillospiraceae bacterium]MBR2977922.1 GTPase Era [Oscillospiraceae bacterium]MBR3849248.1 GTPase Era [Oscillospiraceae bacterium]
MMNKSAMIAIVGRPNVGKSTLTNRIVGEKIAIVSNKPQTTRNRICGVVNRGDTQLVFLDTPGFHRPRTKLGDYMVNIVRQSVSDVDAALLLVEPIAGVGEREADLIERIRAAKVPAVLAINKCDTVEKASLLAVIDAYAKEYDFKAILPISAKTGEGVEELLAEVTKLAPEGPQLFPEDMITDQPERQLVAEILREKLLWCLEREVPHGTAVEITAFNEREDGVIDIDATIYCEKSSHKGIIIGKRGEMLKKISSMAREDCEKLLDSKVYLQTWVKVKENWRESNTLIRNFGYQ